MKGLHFNLSEIDRRLANLIKVGRIHTVHLEDMPPSVKVKIGNFVSGKLPYMTLKAGTDKSWWPIEAEEQVLVLSPSGELDQGIVIGAIFQNSFSPTTRSPDVIRQDYSDGAFIEYDKSTSHLRAILPGGATAELVADGGIRIVGDVTVTGNIKASGDITDKKRSMDSDRSIFNSHFHNKVKAGTDNSDVPVQKQ